MCVVNHLLKKTLTVCIVAAICSFTSSNAFADPSFSFGDGGEKNAECMSCHEDKLVVGDSNKISAIDFEHTTHAQFGCRTCHNNVPDSHPDGNKIKRTTACIDCHADISAQYLTSKHSLGAPDCGSCHNPHNVKKANEISASQLNSTCNACHDYTRISALHAQWLPQTNLHLGAITCVTCHTKIDNFVLSVYILRRDVKNNKTLSNVADFNYLKQKAGTENIHQLVDGNLDNYISIEELKAFSKNPANKDLYLKAMLTPSTTSHLFKTSDESFNCTLCHASGPNTAQIVKLVLPNKSGTYSQMDVEKGGTFGSLHSIPDFYMMSSSRNSILNKLGVLILAGGMIMPVGHGFIRFLTRKNREKE